MPDPFTSRNDDDGTALAEAELFEPSAAYTHSHTHARARTLSRVRQTLARTHIHSVAHRYLCVYEEDCGNSRPLAPCVTVLRYHKPVSPLILTHAHTHISTYIAQRRLHAHKHAPVYNAVSHQHTCMRADCANECVSEYVWCVCEQSAAIANRPSSTFPIHGSHTHTHVFTLFAHAVETASGATLFVLSQTNRPSTLALPSREWKIVCPYDCVCECVIMYMNCEESGVWRICVYARGSC